MKNETCVSLLFGVIGSWAPRIILFTEFLSQVEVIEKWPEREDVFVLFAMISINPPMNFFNSITVDDPDPSSDEETPSPLNRNNVTDPQLKNTPTLPQEISTRPRIEMRRRLFLP